MISSSNLNTDMTKKLYRTYKSYFLNTQCIMSLVKINLTKITNRGLRLNVVFFYFTDVAFHLFSRMMAVYLT